MAKIHKVQSAERKKMLERSHSRSVQKSFTGDVLANPLQQDSDSLLHIMKGAFHWLAFSKLILSSIGES